MDIMKKFSLLVTFLSICIGILPQRSYSVEQTDEAMESGIYLGVMSFNQALYTYPISLLSSATKSGYDTFIDGMTMKNGTILCYSVDEAVNTLQAATLPADISTVALITFTDGLDQGSLMITDKYDSDEDYLTAIKGRIDGETVVGKNILAYSIGLRGEDVSTEADIAKFRSTLKQLASSDENATEVTSMSEVNAKFQEIAEQLNQTRHLQTISLKMPGLSNGTRVRFTFDNVSSADYSEVYIEGTFNLRERSLSDVEYHGMTCTSGTVISGVTEGIFVTFTFENIQTESNTLLSEEYISEWYMTSASSWQINSEFDGNENTDIINEKKSAAIMLVLDCSSSLGSQFSTAQSNAKSFIATLCNSSDDSSGGEGGSSDNLALYSTTPIDLSLAVSFNKTRYYLTQEQYTKANLSNAVVEGVTIVTGDEAFIIALEDEPTEAIISSDEISLSAFNYYRDNLPTYKQGQVISSRWSYINNAITAFGGTKMDGRRWLNYTYNSGSYTYCAYTYNGSGSLGNAQANNTSYCYKLRPVKPVTASSPIQWRSPLDLTLAVEKDGIREYIARDEYTPLSEDYNILGVAVVAGDEKFIISLEDEPTEAITGSAAHSLYQSSLPSLNQGMIISGRWSYINDAITAFGGTKMDGKRWLNGTYNSGTYTYYCYTYDLNGDWDYQSSSNTCKVRLVQTDPISPEYKEENFALTDGSVTSFSQVNDVVYNSITYTRNFRNTNWQALYVPFEIPYDNIKDDFEIGVLNDVRQYDRDDDGVKDETIIEAFKMTSGTLEANYPYLIRAKEIGEKAITVTDATLYATEENSIDCSSVNEKFTFTGTYSQMSSDKLPQSLGYYALSGGVWKPVAEGASLGAFRFYLKTDNRNNPTSSNAIRMRVIGEDGEDDATSIDSPMQQANDDAEMVIYDLQGRRVTNPTKGVYIVNGKKHIY